MGTNNQITTSGFTYDGVGNELTDVTNAYAWDAESQIKTANSINYLYDGEGNRVQKSNGKIYWYGAGSEILDESDLSGNITNEYVFFGGKRIAYKAISWGRTFYYAEDMLGTSRVMTTSTGTVCYDADFYPFGGEDTFNNGCPQNYKFTGKERDAETDNDDFGARYYSSTYGRWLSADWSAIPAPVPYANLTNPQTLNLYAMVGDSPETFADLDGHVGGLGGPEVLPSYELDDPTDEGGGAFTPPQKHLGGSGFEDLDHAAANYYATEQDRQAQDQNGAATGATGQNQTAHFVSVADYYSRVGGFGNIGVGVDSDDTQGFSTANPKTPWYERFFGAPKARVEDDIAQHTNANGNVAPHFNVHIPISAAQATAMQAAIDKRTADPGRYNLFFRNCAGFVESVLHAGGVSGVPHGEVFVPNVLGTMLWYGNTWR